MINGGNVISASTISHTYFYLISFFFSLISVSSSAANSLSGDCQGTYCAIPSQSFRTPRDNAYTISFSPVPVFNNPHGYPHSWKDSGYGTNQPKSRSGMQTFSRTGTLPSYFPQQQQDTGVGGAEIHKQSPNIVTVATALEVATIF